MKTLKPFSNRALLLDVDGVLVPSRSLKNLVCRRASRFVSETVRVSRRDGARINRLLYQNYGHTVTGLQMLYDYQDGMQAFNEFVYDAHVLSALREDTRSTANSPCADSVHRVLWRCHQRQVPVYLFSNAPRVWVMQYVEAMGIPEEILPGDRILCGDDVLIAEHGLKPSKNAYKAVGDMVQSRHHGVTEMVLVDDSFANLAPLLSQDVSGWIPVLFSPDRKHSALASRRLVQIYALDQALRLAFP